MATVHSAFGGIMGGGAPVFAPSPRAVQTITSSGSSQATTAAAAAHDYVTVTPIGGAVFVAIGQAPVAASGAGYLIPDGAMATFGPLASGDKVALIDAA